MSRFMRWFGLSGDTNDGARDAAEKAGKLTEFLDAEKIMTASEFLQAAGEKLGSADVASLSAAIDAALPWVEVIGEALPPVRAAAKLLGFLTKENDPRVLGLLAVSLAYQASAAKAVKQIEAAESGSGSIGINPRLEKLRGKLDQAKEEPESFNGFHRDAALRHPLIVRADEGLRCLALEAQWSEKLTLLLTEEVHKNFVENFNRIISDDQTREKFDPLFRYLMLAGRQGSTFSAIEKHIAYQLWCFSMAPSLGSPRDVEMRVPLSLGCPLADIYMPPDCGILRWSDIMDMRREIKPRSSRRTPFDEKEGGREPMLARVLTLLQDPHLDDAIVIQGVAGAGKSAFTLHLCAKLRELGLRPVRIRMRHLLLDGRTTLFEDMAQAIVQNSSDAAFKAATSTPPPSTSEIEITKLFDEVVPFRGANICPHVLIFDGWDEISISASEGFRKRIEDTLGRIRSSLINYQGLGHVRVILTGRPSFDVQETGFLRSGTPILTIRSLRPEQVGRFAETLLLYRLKAGGTTNELRYRIKYLLESQTEQAENSDQEWILGLPLLALLSIWITLNEDVVDPALARDRTTLYRRLVDITSRYGGNMQEEGVAAKISGRLLRELLRQTAAAMTILGTESISEIELKFRLRQADFENDTHVEEIVEDNPIAKLMISFFFSTGTREQGCEFMHKSFREYLFAEAIVAALKSVGSRQERPSQRRPYWKNFSDGSPERNALAALGPLLGAQWMSGEVGRHVTSLIAWEVHRSATGDEVDGRGIEPLSLEQWKIVRDTLASLWDWWAEGVHLRPQPFHQRTNGALDYEEPYTDELIRIVAPHDLPRGQLPEPVRTVTIDAHLGDALFRLNCAVHFRINEATGWLEEAGGAADPDPTRLWVSPTFSETRRYQVELSGGRWIAFAPSTPDGNVHFMQQYFNRINAAGWHPNGSFPNGIDMTGIDLSHAVLSLQLGDVNSKTRVINLRYARLNATAFMQSYFEEGSSIEHCIASNALFFASHFYNVSFRGSVLDKSHFQTCYVERPEFSKVSLSGSFFAGTTFVGFQSNQITGVTMIDSRFSD